MKPYRVHALTVLAMFSLLAAASAGTLEQARGILIPEFTAEGEPAATVLAQLRGEVRRHDPAHEGINILLLGNVPEAVKLRPITMHARKVSAEELVEQFCRTAGLECRFGEAMVVIGKAPLPAPDKPGEAKAKPTATRLKAGRLIVAEFSVEGEALPNVLARLQLEARKLDPDKKGLKIVLNLSEADGKAAAEAVLDLEARQVSIEALLEYCCRPLGLDCEFGEELITVSGKLDQQKVSTEFDAAWEKVIAAQASSLPAAPKPAPAKGAAPGKATVATPLAGTRVRASGILIPTIKLTEATPTEAFAEIRRLARSHDPVKQGINFVFQLSPAGKARMSRGDIDLFLNRISLDQVIRYTCLASGLHHRFDQNAVIISDRPIAGANMRTEVFRVAPGVVPPRHTRPKPKKIDWQD